MARWRFTGRDAVYLPDPAVPMTNPPPIKVMHIIARLNIGGAALYVVQVVAHLDPAVYEGEVVCGTVGAAEGDMQYVADSHHVRVTLMPSLSREISPLKDLRTVYQLWRLIRRERPQIVHTHTAKAGFVGRSAAWLAGVPVIIHTFHGHVFAGYFSPAKTRVFLTLERICARLSSAVITLSEALKHEIADVYHVTDAKHIEVIELGFELDTLAAQPRHQGSFREKQNIPADVPLIGIVGRLVPIKNHDLFLAAARIVHEQRPDAYFAIVGDGERRAELESLVKSLGLQDCVRFTGWITDTPPVYSALDALVLSSRNEGLPVSLIEALAAGVPVIATQVGGVVDLLDQGRLGAIVPPDDAGAMAQAVLAALSGSGVADDTRKFIAQRYGIQRSTDQTAALYQRLLQERVRR